MYIIIFTDPYKKQDIVFVATWPCSHAATIEVVENFIGNAATMLKLRNRHPPSNEGKLDLRLTNQMLFEISGFNA